ncbi:MAG: HEPN domain-containing protein, partial [Bacteroidales bacterium]|nr:HEPN domain-containing protein [Bacteroidales bacterium]
MTDAERIDVVKYRIENAEKTLAEVAAHIQNGYYNTAVNRMYYACFYAASALLF